MQSSPLIKMWHHLNCWLFTIWSMKLVNFKLQILGPFEVNELYQLSIWIQQSLSRKGTYRERVLQDHGNEETDDHGDRNAPELARWWSRRRMKHQHTNTEPKSQPPILAPAAQTVRSAKQVWLWTWSDESQRASSSLLNPIFRTLVTQWSKLTSSSPPKKKEQQTKTIRDLILTQQLISTN